MGRTPSTTHRWLFCRALYPQPSNQKFGRGAYHLLFLNKISWAVRSVLSHDIFYCDRTNLTPSDNKLVSATLYVYISLGTSETITNYSLLITNCIFAPSDKKFGAIREAIVVSLVPSDS